MSLQNFHAENFVFDYLSLRGSVNGAPTILKMAAKRYTQAHVSRSYSPEALTLLLIHGVGTHKEQWETTLLRIFNLLQANGRQTLIREAWAFDWQSHGDSAILNKKYLRSTSKDGILISEWAEALSTFVLSEHVRDHKLVAIGHSAGNTAILQTTEFLSGKRTAYKGLILVEPTFIDRQVYKDNIQDRERVLNFTNKATLSRRDTWENADAAFDWFKKRMPWKTWDQRVLRLYTQYGLVQAVPDCVALKCDKGHEASGYLDIEPHFVVTEQMANVCGSIPIHLIFGEINDASPRYAQDSIVNEAKGRRVASVTRIPGAGHMVLQQKPDALADTIYGILETLGTRHTKL